MKVKLLFTFIPLFLLSTVNAQAGTNTAYANNEEELLNLTEGAQDAFLEEALGAFTKAFKKVKKIAPTTAKFLLENPVIIDAFAMAFGVDETKVETFKTFLRIGNLFAPRSDKLESEAVIFNDLLKKIIKPTYGEDDEPASELKTFAKGILKQTASEKLGLEGRELEAIKELFESKATAPSQAALIAQFIGKIADAVAVKEESRKSSSPTEEDDD